jgi:hypothetical protein
VDVPSGSLFERLKRTERVAVRRWIWALALLLVSPSVFSGFAADDYILLYELRASGARDWAGTPPLDLYRLFDPAHVKRLIDGAGLPWWTYAEANCAFMRPLSGLTHLADQYLAPNNPLIAHLQNLLWFGLLIGLVAAAYRRLLDHAWAAGLASAMFALDSAHGSTVGWIVNRSALIGAAFGVAALLCHDRWRRAAGSGYAVAAWACFALGMFSAELSLGSLGYLLAYALFIDRGSLGRRTLSLLPYALLSLVWAAARRFGQYGTSGLYTYVDPVHEPLAFAITVPARILLLLASQVSRLCSDFYEMVPAPFQVWFLLTAAISCGATLWFAWPSLRTSRPARFWGAGAVLSAVPMAATQPSDRLLTLIGVGALPVLAQAIHDSLQHNQLATAGVNARSLPVRVRARFAVALCALHLLVAPLLLPITALGTALLDGVIQTAERSLPMDARTREQTVFVAAVPDSAFMSYLPVMRSVNGKPRPRRLYWLVSTQARVQIERRALNVLRVSPARGFFDRRSEARSPLHPFSKGAKVELSDMTVHVVELTSDGRPAVCDFVFREPLESADYVWRTWRNGRLEPLPLLKVGQSASLDAS